MSARRALLIVNRLSRSGETDISSAIARLAGHGIEVALRSLSDPLHIPPAIREHGDPLDMVIVAGGDGTLNCAVDALVERELPLGILPLGTANDLARTLMLPLSIEEACDVIGEGRLHRIDLGWVNGKHFFNVASMGLSVRISQELTRELKQRWGLLSYAICAARALQVSRSFKAEISHDHQTKRVRAMQIAVGNGRHYGGGMTVADDATIDDGLLHLYSIGPRSFLRYLALLPALRSGRQARWPDVHVLDGPEITVVTRPPLPVNTDGELTTRTPARFRVLPAALPVAVPQRYIDRGEGGVACLETKPKSPSTI